MLRTYPVLEKKSKSKEKHPIVLDLLFFRLCPVEVSVLQHQLPIAPLCALRNVWVCFISEWSAAHGTAVMLHICVTASSEAGSGFLLTLWTDTLQIEFTLQYNNQGLVHIPRVLCLTLPTCLQPPGDTDAPFGTYGRQVGVNYVLRYMCPLWHHKGFVKQTQNVIHGNIKYFYLSANALFLK